VSWAIESASAAGNGAVVVRSSGFPLTRNRTSSRPVATT
jgi:hypothetical protein